MVRKSENQTTHDNRVRREASKLKQEGWHVQADLSGYDTPTPIGKDNRIPDILATRGDRVKIIEVETPNTVEAHRDQQTTFRRSASQKDDAEFELIITTPRKP